MIIDGRKLAEEIERETNDKLEKINQKKVAFVMFQNTPAIEQFVQMKMKVGTRFGIDCSILKFEGEINNKNAIKFLEKILQVGPKGFYDGVVVINRFDVIKSIVPPRSVCLDACCRITQASRR